MTDVLGAPARITLRPYQLEACERVTALEARGVRSCLGVAACGLGKTIIFAEVIRRRGGRALILAHRDELIGQAAAKFAEVDPDRADQIGIVRAASDEVGAGIVVASVQTLARPNRLARLIAAGEFSTVVVDEAHHTHADTYRRILAALEAGAPGGPFLFGVTATPERGDGAGLADLFEEIAFSFDILWGIRAGYLCDVRARSITLEGFDEKDLKVRRGDFTAESSGRALTDAEAPRHIVAGWQAEANDRKTLVFTPTVALAEAVADEFTLAGIPAGWVSGDTPKEDRRRLLREFAAGDITVLSNCAVLTEGYDEPSIECMVIARPTKSQALYVQMAGRCLRRHPGKTDALILDVVGASDRHSLITIPTLFGLEDDDAVRAGEKPIAEAVAEHEQELVEAGRIAARDAELFHRVDTSPIAWVSTLDTRSGLPAYVRTLGSVKRKGEITYLPTVHLIRRHPSEDLWVCGLVFENGSKRVLIDRVPLEVAQGVGEDYVRKAPANHHITARGAAWRGREPSVKALELAGKWRVKVPEGCTAGELSDLLDVKIAAWRAKKGK